MLGVIPWKVADQEAVLPVELNNVGRNEVERSVVPNLLRVHQADDRPGTLGYDPVDPLEDLWCGLGRKLSPAPAELVVVAKRPVCGGKNTWDDPD